MEPTEVENEARGHEVVIDATQLPPRQRHQLIFERFAELAVGDAFILSNTHDPKPLRREFDQSRAGEFSWDYVESGPERWQVRIGRVAQPPVAAADAEAETAADAPSTAPVPKLLCDARSLAEDLRSLSAGAVWKLAESDRQLDANLVHLPAGRQVDEHAEPALDVLFVVVSGSGVLESADGEKLSLAEGRVIWLPRGSRRSLSAGDEGLLYLTVHRRRPGMSIQLIER
jgi:uncharacterized protein (DUF2249 family)/quercetin dioxygenase-like cupin family protein